MASRWRYWVKAWHRSDLASPEGRLAGGPGIKIVWSEIKRPEIPPSVRVCCAEHHLDPLTVQRADVELFVRWLEEMRRFKPSTVSRRLSVVTCFTGPA